VKEEKTIASENPKPSAFFCMFGARVFYRA